MSQKDLTSVQRSVLLTLMIKAGPVPNTFLRNVARISLTPRHRDQLRDDKLITVAEKPLVLELTEKGWAETIKEFKSPPPAGAGAVGGTLYLLLDFLHDYFEQNELAPSQFFTARVAAPAARMVETKSLETRIRSAYAVLAKKPGDFVMLDVIRGELADASTAEIDATLVELNGAPDVNLIPESNQKVLTAAERAAAVSIGNQDKHLISIDS